VVRVVTEGSVSVASVAGIVVVAVGFLVFGGLVGLRVAPPLFALVERVSRSTGTVVAIALAFTLGFAQLADAAQLAPIVGAFVAGIALSRAAEADRIRRELAPVGHLFIPVFFLQIGIDADVGAFGSSSVLRDAALLLVVAVIGKLVSPLGAVGSPGDKVLIGLGMLPRGEVGLIFATIGLQNAVLDDDLYAALLLVVLVTTLATPQLLKLRYSKLRRQARPDGALAGAAVLPFALDAAIAASRTRPEPELLDQLAGLPDEPLLWDAHARDRLLDLIERGNARSWRFLASTGVLARALPELDAAMHGRDDDPFALDPLQGYRLRSIERLRSLDADEPLAEEIRSLSNVDDLLLAALLVEGLEASRDPDADARRVLLRLGVDQATEQGVLQLVHDRDLLWSAARQPGGLGQEAVLQLASHLHTPDRARLLFILSALRDDGRERWEVVRLRQLYELVQSVLADPQLSGSTATTVDDLRRQEALAQVGGQHLAAERVRRAPRGYVLRNDSEVIARHARLIDPMPNARQARVQVAGDWVDVVARDRPGLFAAVTGALAAAGLDVADALVATWDDGAALESFRLQPGVSLEPALLTTAIESAFGQAGASDPLPDAEVAFDDAASPWQTVCEVRSVDQPGLLHALAVAFAAAGIEVHAANVRADAGLVIDRFHLTGRRGEKLSAAEQEAVRGHVRDGVTPKRRRFRLPLTFSTQ
jgi:predicted amino acid-binding ACT domain protein